jgi:hypothetical protein
MKHLVFLSLLVVPTLNASSLTSVLCTYGAVTQASSNPTSSACYVSGVFAFAQLSETINPLSANLIAHAEVAASSPSAPPKTTYQAVAISMVDNLTFETPGPKRQGLIQFDIELGNAHAGAALGLISDGIRKYSLQSSPGGCQLRPCSDIGTLPISLGTEFYVTSDASGSIAGNFAFNNYAFASGTSDITFQLFEADGKTPVKFFAVPEPSTYSTLLLGLSAMPVLLILPVSAIKSA